MKYLYYLLVKNRHVKKEQIVYYRVSNKGEFVAVNVSLSSIKKSSSFGSTPYNIEQSDEEQFLLALKEVKDALQI